MHILKRAILLQILLFALFLIKKKQVIQNINLFIFVLNSYKNSMKKENKQKQASKQTYSIIISIFIHIYGTKFSTQIHANN